jgi:hypothetical protein
MDGGAAGGTGGPLEAGTRGNADPPVPIGKGLFFSASAGVAEVMRAIEPSWFGSVAICGAGIVRGGVIGILAAGGA